MKLIKILFLAGATLFAAAALAQQPKAPSPIAKTEPLEKCEWNAEKTTEHLKKMQEHILAIHDLSTKILAETDPVKKQALKDQQLELLRAQHLEKMQSHHNRHDQHEAPKN